VRWQGNPFLDAERFLLAAAAAAPLLVKMLIAPREEIHAAERVIVSCMVTVFAKRMGYKNYFELREICKRRGDKVCEERRMGDTYGKLGF
jgi:hypothetical protein